MAHVLKSQGFLADAIDMYKQSLATFESMGTANFDTEYACTLSAVGNTISEMSDGEPGETPWRTVIAWNRAAVASCESITGKDHEEAWFYRSHLEMCMRHVDSEAADQISDGATVLLTPEDKEIMRRGSLLA